jgi:hypothetical protein
MINKEVFRVADMCYNFPKNNNLPEGQMKTRVKLKPGQRGTKKLLDQYGDALVCVRYRYDRERTTMGSGFHVDKLKLYRYIPPHGT